MLRLFVVVLAFVYCESVPGAGYGRSAALGYGGLAPLLKGGLSTFSGSPIGAGHSSLPLTGFGGGYGGFAAGYGGGFGGGYGGGYGAGPIGLAGPALAAPVAPLVGPALVAPPPQVLEVAGDDEPVQVIFKSLGTRVNVQQIHTPSGPGQVEATRTEDEPHRVIHEIYRPVIQEIREVIQPFRRLTQEVRPVLEEVHTVVAKNAQGGKLAGPAGLAGAPVAVGGDYKSKRA